MVRIIHSSDFRLGATFPQLGKSGDLVRHTLKHSFETAINYALDNDVDIFLVAGNLFNSNQISHNLASFALNQVARLGKIPFVVLPGTRDILEHGSIYADILDEQRPENFHVLGEEGKPTVYLPEPQIAFYGLDAKTGTAAESFSDIVRQEQGSFHVAVMCDNLPERAEQWQVDPDVLSAFEQSGFDYFALGGAIEMRQIIPKAAFSGAPETLDFSQDEPGRILLVTLGSGEPVIEQVETGKLLWQELNLDSSSFRHNIEVEQELQKYRSPSSLVRINLTGSYNPDGYLDVRMIERENRDQFCFLALEDHRDLSPQLQTATDDCEESIKSEYARLAAADVAEAGAETRRICLEALTAGCALLSGRDVR